MIEINLLPKDYLKASRGLALGTTGKYAAAGVGAVIIALMAITFFQVRKLHRLEADIAKAQQRAAVLRKDIQLVDALSDVKEKITQRVRAIERLDRHRSTYVRILEDIARNVPEFVWLARYEEKEPPQPKEDAKKRKGAKTAKAAKAAPASASPGTPRTVQPVEIEGYTFTLNALAAFMIKMMRSDYFDDVELKELRQDEKAERKAYSFTLSCNVHFLSDEEYRSLAGGDKPASLARKPSSERKRLN